MELVIDRCGQVRCVYDELVDLAALGRLSITRASHVEPDELGAWHADVALEGGPRLGPFACRSQALEAELTWLKRHWLIRQG
jgi:hypothetical protein